MRNLWLIYAIVSVADLILTGLLLEPELEANPAASWIWSTFGYSGIVLYKIVLLSFLVYPACRSLEKRSVFAAKAVLYFGIFSTSITCLLFGGFYLNG
tara:strand:+ start:50 stop:343 length:294 start_codon:yes stop_codon:yes gene_type:complete